MAVWARQTPHKAQCPCPCPPEARNASREATAGTPAHPRGTGVQAPLGPLVTPCHLVPRNDGAGAVYPQKETCGHGC